MQLLLMKTKLTPEVAKIVAHICGDGWLCKYLEKNSLQIVNGRRYKRDRQRYLIGYSNTCKFLLDDFAKDIRSIFGIKSRYRENEVVFKSKRVYDYINSLGGGSTYEWFISPIIQNSNRRIKSSWLQAFFDDESTIDTASKRIRVKSMNFGGLKEVKLLLESLGIFPTITGQNIDRSWYLTINKKEAPKFIEIVGFNHPSKREKAYLLFNSK